MDKLGMRGGAELNRFCGNHKFILNSWLCALIFSVLEILCKCIIIATWPNKVNRK